MILPSTIKTVEDLQGLPLKETETKISQRSNQVAKPAYSRIFRAINEGDAPP